MATMFLAATILLVGSRTSEAQDQSPSPRMLLNLDLFAAAKDGGGAPNTAGGDSMLHQLQTLRSMGYLTSEGPLPESDDEPPAPNEPAQTSRDEQRRGQ